MLFDLPFNISFNIIHNEKFQTILKIKRGNIELTIDGHIVEIDHLKKLGLHDITQDEILRLQHSINLQYQTHIIRADLDIPNIKLPNLEKEYIFCEYD